MDNSVVLVLVGGFVSLVSALAGIAFQHHLEMRKVRVQFKQHPMSVVYNKQTEFLERLAPVLLDINSYITEVGAWLAEQSPRGIKRATDAAAKNECLSKLDDLIQHYYAFLPEKLIRQSHELFSECLLLSSSPASDQADKCINVLFEFQNKIREFVGIDQLSRDFLQIFGPKRS